MSDKPPLSTRHKRTVKKIKRSRSDREEQAAADKSRLSIVRAEELSKEENSIIPLPRQAGQSDRQQSTSQQYSQQQSDQDMNMDTASNTNPNPNPKSEKFQRKKFSEAFKALQIPGLNGSFEVGISACVETELALADKLEVFTIAPSLSPIGVTLETGDVFPANEQHIWYQDTLRMTLINIAHKNKDENEFKRNFLIVGAYIALQTNQIGYDEITQQIGMGNDHIEILNGKTHGSD